MITPQKQLADLRNVGKAILRSLHILGITTVEQLAECDATELYLTLEEKTDKHVHPCAWDVLAAIIHEAQTGKPVMWNMYSPQRRKLFNKNRPLCEHRK